MSDNPDIRPEDHPAADAAVPTPPATPAVPAADSGAPAAPHTAPAPAVPPVPPMPAPPASQPTASQSTGTQPTLPLPGARAAAPVPPGADPMQAPAAPSSQQQGQQQAGPHGMPPSDPYPGQGFGLPAQSAPAPASAPAPTHKSGAGKIVGLMVAAALVGGIAGVGSTWASSNLWSPAGTSSVARPAAVTVNSPESVNATTAIAAKVVPSVVTINVSAGQSGGGTGSGVVLSKDGYVLTNTHVVTLDGQTGKASVSVTTSDGHIYPATIVGTDPVYDLAVIKLEGASDLTPITWGDSSKLNVGDQTIAVGAPLGLSNTVTTGIVSALNRSIEIASSAAPNGGQSDGGQGGQGDQGDSPFYFDFGQGQQQAQQTPQESIKIAVIQTDAPINPGNSGGALVDSAGDLVGINVAIASAGGSSSGGQAGSIGVGFSIPSDVAHRVADELIKDGSATHGLLGASVRDSASLQNATITGAVIEQVTADGGAAKAGLRQGDIVTEFNGVPVGGAVDLTAQVRAAAAGSTDTITYVRDGQTHTTDVTLGALK